MKETLNGIMKGIEIFVKNRPVLKRIMLKLYFDSGYGLNYRSIPFHFGKIPQYYLSRLASWLYGNNILNRKDDSRILQWLNNGEKVVNNPIYDSAKPINLKALSDAIECQSHMLRPLMEILKKKHSTGTLLKVLDIGCGDGITSFALASSMKNYRFEISGFDPASIRINNASK